MGARFCAESLRRKLAKMAEEFQLQLDAQTLDAFRACLCCGFGLICEYIYMNVCYSNGVIFVKLILR